VAQQLHQAERTNATIGRTEQRSHSERRAIQLVHAHEPMPERHILALEPSQPRIDQAEAFAIGKI